MTAPVDFLLLGPLEARQAGRPLRLGSIKHRMLLAKLLLHANQVVSTDELIDTVWGEQPPPTVRQSLQNHVASLRRAIEPSGGGSPPRTLITRDPGYMLQLDPNQLDLHRFRRLVSEGRGALGGEATTALRLLHEALSLWRGPVLADVVATGAAWPELVGIDEERIAALEVRIEAELVLGRHLELIGELEALVRSYPLREHLHGQLMLALYRSGRQADALSAYRAARRILVDELGIEPSLRLQRLEQAVLAQDPVLELLGPAGAGDDPGAAREDVVPTRQPIKPLEPGVAERKLVTVLFGEVDEPAGDSGERDPEDVSSMLERHLERMHVEVASFGGVVEHAIGGTMMAVFGVPQTREDDPERAVRAALAIRDALSGGVETRLAVATGEALVTPGGGPTRVAGDLVTQCARLQQAAPTGAVLVSEATERATSRVISYGPASLLSLPGRAKPVTVWSALEPRNRTGLNAVAAGPVPMIGRTAELSRLLDAFERVRRNGSPELVTVIGAPGIGKSRLVAELWQSVEASRELIAWRQGRSQPYGEGITFWALGEIIKAEAGILESDSTDQVDRKIAQAASYALAGIPDAAAWVTAHLRLLVGGSDERSQPRAGRQEEAFAAWRRFLHGLATRRPLVLVVEDLHWADDALLAFLESLLDRAGSPPGSIPLLLVAITRPELLERRPDWGTGAGATTTIGLEPLSQDDTIRLLGALLGHHRLPGAVGPQLAATVGGNPLFAEEYVRMLRDRGLRPDDLEGRTADDGRGTGQPELPLPETVHAIVAARLDALSVAEKAVLHDAAVLGRVGWEGGLAAIGGHNREILGFCLDRLEAKEFLYRAQRSLVAGEREYGFRHMLIRDVAYGQIPRAERAEKHRRAAAWLESLSAERVDDRPGRRGAGRAELLAHHYGRALAFARAAAQPSEELALRARLALRAAGDRVTALGVHATAARYYARALELWPEEDPERPELEFRAGRARQHSEGTGEELLARALEGLLAAGARERAAEAEILLGKIAHEDGRPGAADHVERAVALVKEAAPSRSQANVLHGAMMYAMVAERSDEAIALARRVLHMAVEFGMVDIEAAALETTGMAKVQRSGDPAGLADLERAIQLIEQLPSMTLTLAGSYGNLAQAQAWLGDLPRCFAARAAAERAAERHGAAHRLRWMELERVAEHYWSGRWDEAVRKVDAMVLEAAGGKGHRLECACRVWRGRIRLARGDTAAALADSAAALDLARLPDAPNDLDGALAFRARAMLAADRADEARTLIEELLKSIDGRLLSETVGIDLPIALVGLGYPVEALEGVLPTPWRDAASALVGGDARRAAQVYATIGSRPDAADAHLVAARQLLATGQATAGRSELTAAIGFYRGVGATASLREAEDLLPALV